MTYKELCSISKRKAVEMVTINPEDVVEEKDLNSYPDDPAIIVFGGHYWEDEEKITEYIIEYIQPNSEADVQWALRDITLRILRDPMLYEDKLREKLHRDYQLIFKQYSPLINTPNRLTEFATSKGTYLWIEHILIERRKKQFESIKKEQDDKAMIRVSKKIQKIYGFTDTEMIYLQYFCSQAKTDELDPSDNTLLYCWSDAKRTGKTTVASYIVSFLNGESTRNEDQHKSKLSIEMQVGDKFSIPKAVSSRCILLDEGGFFDMRKSYEDFKTMVTSNSCEIRYMYQNSRRTKRCNRNYVMTSQKPPSKLIQDEDERRIIPIHFNKSFEKVSFDDLDVLWREFVLECNLDHERLHEIYDNFLMKNPQAGDSKFVMIELMDVISKDFIANLNSKTYFSVSNVIVRPEIEKLKGVDRDMVKTVLIKLYGEPDGNQRFHKMKREIIECQTDENENTEPDKLPF